LAKTAVAADKTIVSHFCIGVSVGRIAGIFSCHLTLMRNMIVIMSEVLFHKLWQEADRSLSLSREEKLFHRGDRVTLVYLLAAGAVDLVRYQRDGGTVVLDRAKEQSIVAEASLYSERYHCDCICTEPVTVRTVSRDRVIQLLLGDSDLAAEWSAYLAAELQNTRHRCDLLTRKTVAERLSGWLDWNGALPPKGRWKSIALEIGVTPEALYREIKRMRQ
jgi:CRP/FNR family transcriptional regulator, dissimilatory nitrate respiration regulator